MGIEHGLFCVGCCWELMLALFALGVMSVTWMVVIGALIFAEKVLPAGEWFARVVAVVLVAAGIWIAVSPSTFPGLHLPSGGEPSMHMDSPMS